MCWMCDNPGATEAGYNDHMRALIARYGHAVQGVEGDGTHPPWAYTAGLAGQGLPELVVTGMDLVPAAGHLNAMAPLARRGQLPPAGVPVLSPSGVVFQAVEVTRPWAHLVVAVGLYGRDIRAVQLVHPDDAGRWPWEDGYAGIRGGQPVLGTPAGT